MRRTPTSVGERLIVAEGEGVWTEYAGGYSDMVNQRGYGVTKPEKSAANKAARGGRGIAMEQIAPAAPKGKLSFKQKHGLETLPKEIKKLDTESARLNKLLADPNLYAKDPKGFADASAKLTAAEAAKSKAEDEWLALELIREELEG